MALIWNKQAAALLRDAGATKVLATNDRHGSPHVAADSAITLDGDGNIVYLEFLETSQTNSNLVHSLWFKRHAAIYVTNGQESYQIKGIPVRSIICGPLFTHYYKQAVERDAEADLSTVWVIEPEEITNEAYVFRRQQERTERPLVMHLDKLAKASE